MLGLDLRGLPPQVILQPCDCAGAALGTKVMEPWSAVSTSGPASLELDWRKAIPWLVQCPM